MSPLQHIELAPDLTEQVYQRLLDAIGSGELAAGARFTQEEIATSLNVSRQPVVQALQLLKRDGVAVAAGRRGLVVAPIDPQLIGHLYGVRAVLEGLAARQAALAGAKIDAALLVRGRKAVEGERLTAMIEADIAFHAALYEASGNPLIADSAHRHWHHIRRAMGAVLRTEGFRKTVWDEHEEIVAAIAAGDAERAEQSARRHCEVAGRILVTRLEERARMASST